MNNALMFISSAISIVLLAYFMNFIFLTILSASKPQTYYTRRFEEWPTVTVQIPIYNEYYVAERILNSVCNLDYPSDKLQVIVIDDSTDETSEIIARSVDKFRGMGMDVIHLRRKGREGYKAGALREALKLSRGEFVAIFDADFVPPKDFLKRTIPYFSSDEIALVQARWSHLNEQESSLTKGQALSLNLHFKIEQAAKSAHGYFINFNGTAGIWRKSAIESVGGWRPCLAEDLELSYRAQLAGWRLIYVDNLECPAELPIQIQAAKRQQYRWAYGAMEVARQYLRRIISSDIPPLVKLQAFMQLTRHIPQLLFLIQLIITPLLIFLEGEISALSPFWFLFTIMIFIYAALLSRAGKVSYLPHFLLFTSGMLLNNSYALLKGLLKRGESFLRTPKFGSKVRYGEWKNSKYALPLDYLMYVELGFGIYLTATLLLAILKATISYIPYLALASASLLYSGIYSYVHGRRISVKRTPTLRILKVAIVVMLLIAVISSVLGFANTYYKLERAAAYLDRARATGFVDEMTSYITEAIYLIPESGNPVWLFPTSKTDFAMIRADLSSILNRAEILRTLNPKSDAYQQGIDDLRGSIGVIALQLREAAPFYYVSIPALMLTAIWVAAFSYLLSLYSKRRRLEALVEEKR